MIKVVLFLNQVLSGFGEDERMNIAPLLFKGAAGPGMILRPKLKPLGADIVGTLICGDNYFLENKEEAINSLLDMITKLGADIVICGPALNYKRYGECCGHLAKAIEERLNIRAFAAMAPDSTGTEMFRKELYIIKTPGRGGIGLNDSLKKITNFAVKLAKKQPIGSFSEEGYFSRE